RSRGARAAQPGPAAAAAVRASAQSAGEASATSASTPPVAGSVTARRRPPWAARHSPARKSPVGAQARASRSAPACVGARHSVAAVSASTAGSMTEVVISALRRRRPLDERLDRDAHRTDEPDAEGLVPKAETRADDVCQVPLLGREVPEYETPLRDEHREVPLDDERPQIVGALICRRRGHPAELEHGRGLSRDLWAGMARPCHFSGVRWPSSAGGRGPGTEGPAGLAPQRRPPRPPGSRPTEAAESPWRA